MCSFLHSGRSTPVPLDAPPSVQVVSTTRKQVRADVRRRLFPTIEYASRVSHFDPDSDYRDFQGFFVLFWIGLAIMAITTMARNMKDTGNPFRHEIWQLFTVKTWELAVADLLMSATMCLSLPLHRLFRSFDILRWKNTGMTIQSLFEAAWFSIWIAVPFHFEWTWTAQVFLVLHTLTLLMKMHSYAFYNGHLSEAERRLKELDQPSTASKEPAVQYPSSGASPTDDNGFFPDISDEKSNLAALREDLARELVSPLGNQAYPKNLKWEIGRAHV